MASRIELPVKITRPRMTSVLARQRLFNLLDDCRNQPVTWITGPAGSGKTTLVSSYIEQKKLPYLWYRVDGGDTDPATFFHYFGLAAGNIASSESKKAKFAVFTPEYSLGLPIFTRRFFENLFQQTNKPTILIFDNFQQVAAESSFPIIIHHASSVIPDGIGLFILSRTSPPPLMARMVANHKIRIVGWEDLRLTHTETGQLIDKYFSQELTDSEIGQIQEKIDGWVAGLMLLAKQPKTKSAKPHLIADTTPQIIFDYFAHEVFENVTDDIQEFLLNTVFLPRMTSGMADALTEQTGSEEFLSKLYRDNFFINKHTGTADYYQYHSLFREFLRFRSNKKLSAPKIMALQRKAAELLESNGLIEDAVDLYRQFGESEPLIDLIIRNAPDLIVQGRHKTLHHWLNSLPNEIVFNDPWLLYWLATSIFPFKFAASRPLYEKAFNLFERQNIAEGIILSLCGIFYAIGYAFDSFELFDKWLPRLRNYRLKFSKQLSNENKTLLTTCALYALSLRTPRHDSSSEWRREAHSLLDQNLDLGTQIQLMLPLAYFYLWLGELPKAESLLKMFHQRAAIENVTPFMQIILGNGNTFYHWLAADFDSCDTFCKKTLKLAETTGIYGINFFILAHGAAGALSTGDLKRAQELLDKMGCHLAKVGAWSKGLFYNLRLWKDLITGDHVKANHDSDLALHYSEASGSPLTSAAAYWAIALALNLVGKTEPADNKLNEALELCDKFGSLQIKFGCLLTKARFAFDRNEDTKGKKALVKAFSLGSKKAFFNTFFWLSDVMSILCGKALARNIQVPYVCEIIRKRQLRPTDDHLHLQNWPWPIRIFTLGRFDIQVNETPLIYKKKAPKKPISLLKTLVALGSREVSENLLLEALWPELDGDAAHSAFTSCLHRLRKLLGNEEAIRVQEGKVSINHRICWVDMWPYEKLLNQAENFLLDPADKNKQLEAVKLIEKSITKSKGVFMPADSSPWIITKRERLKNKFLICLRSLIQSYEAARKWDQAVSAYNQGIRVEPLAEDFYRGLMRCYKRLDRHSEIISTYRICQSSLSTLAGLKPSQETVDLYRSLI